MNIVTKVVLCNLIGVLAIIIGFYLLIKEYRLLTIIVGAIGLTAVLRGMKIRLQKVDKKKLGKIIPQKRK